MNDELPPDAQPLRPRTGCHRFAARFRPAVGARRFICLLAAVVATGCVTSPAAPDGPAADAPDPRTRVAGSAPRHASYAEALAAWRDPQDLNRWIGSHFEYDVDRAVALSETQRAGRPGPAIIEPARFFDSPKGVCVDLARFAVETLQRVAPETRPRYLMIEFDPTRLRGQVLRRHWVVTYRTPQGLMIFADSKRPGVAVGPYSSIDAFLADYARYRGRVVVSHREADSTARSIRRQRAGTAAGDS